jgi:hypothetical protein
VVTGKSNVKPPALGGGLLVESTQGGRWKHKEANGAKFDFYKTVFYKIMLTPYMSKEASGTNYLLKCSNL